MICKVKRTIEKFGLLKDIRSLAVGVSGGADSMCLLEILSKLKQEYGIILKVVHLNHNIRGEEALRDKKTVEAYCKKLGIECLSFSYDIPSLSKEMGMGEEECGRVKRYECYNMAKCDAVATAHTLSDSIETMVFNLLRGTGTKGLCGIPARRDNIIRPLIECTRKEIESYCESNNIPFVTDSTNLSDDYTRNYIRHNIVTTFSKINPDFEKAIASAMDTITLENNYLSKEADDLLDRVKNESGYKTSLFLSADPAVRRRAIVKILSENMPKDVEKRHIDLADNAVLNQKGKIEITKDLYIVVSSDIISIQIHKTPAEKWKAYCSDGIFKTPAGIFRVEAVSSAESKNAIDADKIKSELYMSSRQDGDCFFSRKRGNTKTLKKLFNEHKIPAEKRNSVAILRDGENIVWVEGFGTDGKYLPDINTKNVLIIKKDG